MMDLGFRQLLQPMSTEIVLRRSFLFTAAIVGGGGEIGAGGGGGGSKKWEAVGF